MGAIKLIHISDILMGLPQTDVDSRVNQIQQAANTFELYNNDYLIISGNITQDGSRDSFIQAQEFIQQIARILLIRDGQNIRFNRVVVVPGKNDIVEPAVSESHYSNFKNFYDDLFTTEISDGRCKEFRYNKALVRELKDITIIGICCWQNNSDGEIDGILERRIKPLYKANSQISSLRYANTTPTILVTAETPSQAWSPAQIYDQSLREFLINNLKITLNVFGSGNASCINPEPFSFKHISIGTGFRSNREIWPLRINLIEINKINQFNINYQTDSNKKFYLRVTGFQRRGNLTPWEKEEFFSQSLDDINTLNYSSNNWNQDYICIEFLRKLEAKNPGFRPGIVLVRGFPGSGKENIFQDSQKNITIGNHDILVIVGTLHSYANSNEESLYETDYNEQLSYTQEFSRIKRILETVSHNNSIKKIIVLYDFAFAKTPNTEKRQALSRLRYDLSSFSDSTIVYISELLDFTTGFDNHCIAVLELTTFTDSVNRLVEHYCYQIPVRSEHINCLAGRYLEFSNLFLQESRRIFNRWSGSEPISQETSDKLIEQAIRNSRPIKEKSQSFRKTIEAFNGGAVVFRYIQKTVKKSISDRSRLFHERLNSIYISSTKLRQEVDSIIGGAALEVMQLLTEYRILENDPFDETQYQLKLVLPFLISVDTYSLFISFPAKLQPQAEDLNNMLNQIAESEGKTINSWIFTRRIGETSSITSRINEALKNSKNLIVLFEDRNFSSPYTEGEYSSWERIWRERWRDNDAKCIPIALNGISTDIPYAFNAYDIIDASNGLNIGKATEIFNLLIPDDSPV